ncbi:hypothetical protein C8F04DRAFT_1129530 [Mycena alexandri]|uniref:Uncharacterized protein n=1 Tax=Mycena alexandri TaxID=1745969 RepID=A0AAD6SCI0_9AGAR|nr:hypothetical protein C8F04DRAFT_1129530 [Mycena alexandri]
MALNGVPVTASLGSDLDWFNHCTSLGHVVYLDSGECFDFRCPALPASGTMSGPTSSTITPAATSAGRGGLGMNSAPTLTSPPRGADVVGVSPPTAWVPPGWGDQTLQTRTSVESTHDDDDNTTSFDEIPILPPPVSASLHGDPFMAARHMNMSSRESVEKWKSAKTLCTEFLVHRCVEACLILKSEALLCGLNPLQGCRSLDRH